MIKQFTSHTFKHLRIAVQRYGDHPVRPDLVLLHGFLGSGSQFRHLIPPLCDVANPVTLDICFEPSVSATFDDASSLSSSGESYDSAFGTDILVDGLHHVVSSALRPAPVFLGYSMGGRLALSWATRYPEHAAGLVLESTTAGIIDAEERKKRLREDADRAKRIRSDYMAFLDEWEQNPLFQKNVGNAYLRKTIPELQLEEIQRNQDPEQASLWLEQFGTGAMPPVWDRLKALKYPVHLITGEKDPKFCTIAGHMSDHLQDSKHVVIPGAAHRVHIDAPDAYLSYLLEFIRRLR